MGECTVDLPTMAAIKFDGCYVRLNDAETQYFMAARDNFSLRLREQTPAYPTSPAFKQHP